MKAFMNPHGRREPWNKKGEGGIVWVLQTDYACRVTESHRFGFHLLQCPCGVVEAGSLHWSALEHLRMNGCGRKGRNQILRALVLPPTTWAAGPNVPASPPPQLLPGGMEEGCRKACAESIQHPCPNARKVSTVLLMMLLIQATAGTRRQKGDLWVHGWSAWP